MSLIPRMNFSPFKIALVVVFGSIILTAIGGAIYWRTLVGTPQYALAELIDSARRGDDEAIRLAIDTNAVVEDFVPQVTAKAAEMYGRGIPPAIIARLASVASPIMPIVKERARVEIPRRIREMSAQIEDVPFVFLVIGADRYFDVRLFADRAIAVSMINERQFELTLRKQDGKWRIVGIKDEQAATEISRRIGEEIIEFALRGNDRRGATELDGATLDGLLKQAEDLLK